MCPIFSKNWQFVKRNVSVYLHYRWFRKFRLWLERSQGCLLQRRRYFRWNTYCRLHHSWSRRLTITTRKRRYIFHFLWRCVMLHLEKPRQPRVTCSTVAVRINGDGVARAPSWTLAHSNMALCVVKLGRSGSPRQRDVTDTKINTIIGYRVTRGYRALFKSQVKNRLRVIYLDMARSKG